MTTSAKPVSYRLWIPVVIVTIALGAVVFSFAIEHVFRFLFLYLAIVFACIGLWAWWVFLAGRFRWKSLLIGILVGASVFALFRYALRFDGSAHGGGALKFAWKWTPESEQNLEELPDAGTAIVSAERDPDLKDFPGFLGKNRDGRVPNPGLATDWETNPPEELWRIQVGLGWSSFAVVGDRAITQEQRGEEELVTCYHAQTGQFLWSHSDEALFSEPMGSDGPRATPTIHDDTVYALGATGILNALNIENGEPIWSRSVLQELAQDNIEWGKSASPLVVDDLVIVTGGNSESECVVAYDRLTGELAWKSGDGPASYSSPVLMTLQETDQVVTVLGDNVSSFEPTSGKLLWRFDWPGTFAKVAQPIRIDDNRLLVTSSYGIPSNLLKVERQEGKWNVQAVWTERQMKTKFSSAVVRGDYAYGLDEGKMICLEIDTADRVWKGGRYGYGQNLLVGEDLILIQTERGDVVLVEATPEEHRELTRISPLSSKTWNAPALAGKFLFVRNDQEAVCLKLP
ncbi:MAG: hypothetical protein CMO55_28300 [Verrucomicrobiales bacterium]|nr:hypothetical protein [Verrucomicrobiales bacterium]